MEYYTLQLESIKCTTSTNQLASSMDRSPSWEAKSHSAIQDIPHLLWNLKVHYCIHNSLPLVPIQSQINLIHTFPLYFPKIHSNIIFPSMPRSFKWSRPFRFSNHNIVCISYLSHAWYMHHLNHPPWIGHPKYGEAYKMWSSSLCSLFQLPLFHNSKLIFNLLYKNKWFLKIKPEKWKIFTHMCTHIYTHMEFLLGINKTDTNVKYSV